MQCGPEVFIFAPVHAAKDVRETVRRIRLIEEGITLEVPATTRCASKPIDLDPITGKVDLVEEENGRPVLAYVAMDGERRSVSPRLMPVSERYGGDEILIELDDPDEGGKRWVLVQVKP